MATPAAFDTGMLLSILQDVYMRYQDPKIERHGRKKGIQHWRIRPFVLFHGVVNARLGAVHAN